MKFRRICGKWFTSRFGKLALAVGLSLLVSACAAKPAPVFFPNLPTPPRLQLLTSFANEGGLRSNKTLDFLIGEELGDRFSKAYGLAFHNGKLYVADSGKASHGLSIVNFETQKIDVIASHLAKPINVYVDDDGTVYVCDVGENRPPSIVVFNSALQYERRFSSSDAQPIFPAATLVIGDNLYVADPKVNLIHVLDKRSGKLLRSFGGDDQLGWPVHLSKTPEGNIVVTETGAQSIRVYSPDGTVVQRIGSPGDRAGNFARPKATAVDRDGNIYVTDVAFNNVQIFNKEGQVLMYFGAAPGGHALVLPAGIALTYDRIDLFQKAYAAPGFTIEYVVAVSSQGEPPMGGSKITLYGFGKMAGYNYE